MGRYYFTKKTKVENCCSINISLLKIHGCLKPHTSKSGEIKWFRGSKERENVNYEVSTHGKYIRFLYKIQIGPTGEDWHNKDCKIQLTTTPCHFGGVRYWFNCKFCNRRAGVLYLEGSSEFTCRHCINLTYQSRNEDKWYRGMPTLPKYEQIEEKIRKLRTKRYKGKPTKRYSKLLQKINSYEQNLSLLIIIIRNLLG